MFQCYLCGMESEKNNHPFAHCKMTEMLWSSFLYIKGLQWVMPKTSGDLPACWNFNGGVVNQER